MASQNLWLIVNVLRERDQITPREVCALVNCDCRKANHLLGHLVRAHVVINVGMPYHPVFQLQPGSVNLKPVKPTIQKPRRQHIAVTEQCRQNWQGYQIHKIFGSARA